MMIHINFIASLIKYIETSKPRYLTLFLSQRKLCLCVKSQPFDVDRKSIKQVEDNLELNNYDTNLANCKNVKRIKRLSNVNTTNPYIQNYVQSVNPKIAEIYPEKYMRIQNARLDTMYLFEEETAKRFVDLIIDDLSKNMTYVAEANPGAGVLTEKLLQAGVTNMHIYEPDESFYPILGNLKKKYPNRLHIFKANLFKMSKLHYLDSQDNQSRVKSIFSHIKKTPWEEKSCMQVIGAIADFVFFKHLIMSVIFQSCFMSQGRTCFYLAIPPLFWNVLNFPGNTAISYSRYVLLRTLFDYKYLGDLKRISYLPWYKEKSSEISNCFDGEILFVIKIEPKANLFVDYLKKNQLLPYWYFVKHHITSKTRRVIPDLEKWIPGCGLRLIIKDYNIFTQFVDLEPHEILNLYKEFASWPEYETCLFLPSTNAYIQVMQQNASVKCVNNYLDEL